MFLYVSLALGQLYPITNLFFVKTKFVLGLGKHNNTVNWHYIDSTLIILFTGGVLVVIFSLVVSCGLNSLWGVKATLLISEVIPFLVLAIGVDNIFILVNTFEAVTQENKYKSVEVLNMLMPYQKIQASSDALNLSSLQKRLGKTLAKVGSSMTLASLSEALAFLLGSLTRMPGECWKPIRKAEIANNAYLSLFHLQLWKPFLIMLQWQCLWIFSYKLLVFRAYWH